VGKNDVIQFHGLPANYLSKTCNTCKIVQITETGGVRKKTRDDEKRPCDLSCPT
jgi:hypothetical protein